MRITFIGLGRMGSPMAINLLHDHPGLLVSSRSGSAYPELARRGASTSNDPVRLACCDLLFLCLPDGAAVHERLFGSDGLAVHLQPGCTVVDTSTTDYLHAQRIAERLATLGIGFVDAPVSGMPSRAADGSLTAMCGGDLAAFERVRPYLQSMATHILHMGPVGSGQLAKLVNQLLFDINCAAIAEILPMAVKLGLDAEKICHVVNHGTGRSHASLHFLPQILANRFDSGYPLENAYKDLLQGANLSAQNGIPLPVLAAATVTYQTALRLGHGSSDKGAMIKVYEALLDVQVRATASC